jgi:hypothetical protein
MSKKLGYIHAIGELKHSVEIAENNAPINEKEGNVEQAKLERARARNCRKAISLLRKAE